MLRWTGGTRAFQDANLKQRENREHFRPGQPLPVAQGADVGGPTAEVPRQTPIGKHRRRERKTKRSDRDSMDIENLHRLQRTRPESAVRFTAMTPNDGMKVIAGPPRLHHRRTEAIEPTQALSSKLQAVLDTIGNTDQPAPSLIDPLSAAATPSFPTTPYHQTHHHFAPPPMGQYPFGYQGDHPGTWPGSQPFPGYPHQQHHFSMAPVTDGMMTTQGAAHPQTSLLSPIYPEAHLHSDWKHPDDSVGNNPFWGDPSYY